MKWKVFIAHAKGEEALAEKIAARLEQAGYKVIDYDRLPVGDSLVEEAQKVLAAGEPVVICGTERAAGTQWAHKIANAVRSGGRGRVFVVQIEQGAYVEPLLMFDERPAMWWADPEKAMQDLVASLLRYYPVGGEQAPEERLLDAEKHYRQLALAACDIISLAYLPEIDRHIATRRIELRRLYVPLRVRIESSPIGSAAPPNESEMGKSSLLARMKGRASNKLSPIGERLALARCIVVLGDPGAGKSTLLHWIATSYLLRLQHDPDWKALPDVATLPRENWLPILIRCRELPVEAITGPLEDMLRHTLRKAELHAQEAEALRDLFTRQLSRGEAILLIDGLDEIADPPTRVRFSQQIERIRMAYPQAPMVVTSRIVGYREMKYRIGQDFEHVMLADLLPSDKDDFVRRWCTLIDPERGKESQAELIRDIHSTDRIERLTGNPMLLTTLALVKRRVGKLPRRRAELYWEAVQVLLNWRRAETEDALELQEALPQLSYLAYAMSDRGLRQLRRDEVINIIGDMREEYPQLHAVRRHDVEQFLVLLERRTGILVQTGEVRHLGMMVPVYEFRHLTFQEYLTARALVDGVFPGRRSRNLAENVAPLAGRTSSEENIFEEEAMAAIESWKEVFRLCMAFCLTDDVDAVMQAILMPLPGEDAKITGRARAILASMCLADEPNVSERMAHQVIEKLVDAVDDLDGMGEETSELDVVVQDLAGSQWGATMRAALLDAFGRLEALRRSNIGAVYSSVVVQEHSQEEGILENLARLLATNEREAIGAALFFMGLAYEEKAVAQATLVSGLLALLGRSAPASHAAAWALYWLVKHSNLRLSGEDSARLIALIEDSAADPEAVFWCIDILNDTKDARLIDAAIGRIQDPYERVRISAIEALGTLKDPKTAELLIKQLKDVNPTVRIVAVKALSGLGAAVAAEPVIGVLRDPDYAVKAAAVNALGRSADLRAIEPLLVMLEELNNTESLNVAIIRALGSLKDLRAVEKLIPKLSVQFEEIAISAASALGMIGDLRAVEPLLIMLEDKRGRIASAAAHALGALQDERAIAPLMAKLRVVRIAHASAIALRAFAPSRPEVLEVMLQNKLPRVRLVAADQLVRQRDKRGLEALKQLFKDESASVREEALRTISTMLPSRIERQLLTDDLDAVRPYLDPAQPISDNRLVAASEALNLPVEEVRRRYEEISQMIPISLSWRDAIE